MVNTKVTLSGITLDNPIIPASGTFGYGYEFAELYDINILGTFSFKGTTSGRPRASGRQLGRQGRYGSAERPGSRALATPPPVSQNVPPE